MRVRPAREDDLRPLAELFAAVAEERDGIASEPPVDLERRVATWDAGRMLVAEADGELVGLIHVLESDEIAMLVAADWRGKGVGSALLAAAIDWARDRGIRKLTLSVFPHNAAGIALYRKFGFVEEGTRPMQIRRQSGELWDLIDMGLVL